jgi:tetratricopeptide (TPR) repeat protein
MEELRQNAEAREAIRFGAFYCLLVRARHLRNFDEFRELVRANRDRFRTQPAMLAMAAEAESYFAFTPREKRAVLNQCRAALKHFDGVGLKLLAAETILDLSPVVPAEEQESLLQEAEKSVEEALAQNTRMPRHLSVLAQILARRNRFAAAREAITQAISMEDSTHSQYSIRIARYEGVRTEIALRESGYELSARLEDAVRDFESVRGNLIELVGLLAAVLALVIVGTQLALNVQATQGAGMLMIIGGVLLLTFAGYSLLIVGRTLRIGRLVAAAVLALLLMGAGTVLIFSLYPAAVTPPAVKAK